MKFRPPQSPSSSPPTRSADLAWVSARRCPCRQNPCVRRASQTGQFPVPAPAMPADQPGRRERAEASLHARMPCTGPTPRQRQQALPSVVDGHWQQQGGPSRNAPIRGAGDAPGQPGNGRSSRGGANARAGQLLRSDRVLTASFSPVRPHLRRCTARLACCCCCCRGNAVSLSSLFGISVLAYPAALWIGLFECVPRQTGSSCDHRSSRWVSFSTTGRMDIFSHAREHG
jgi:hypothetical protein